MDRRGCDWQRRAAEVVARIACVLELDKETA